MWQGRIKEKKGRGINLEEREKRIKGKKKTDKALQEKATGALGGVSKKQRGRRSTKYRGRILERFWGKWGNMPQGTIIPIQTTWRLKSK